MFRNLGIRLRIYSVFKHSVLRLFTVLEKITDFYIWAYKQLKNVKDLRLENRKV